MVWDLKSYKERNVADGRFKKVRKKEEFWIMELKESEIETQID